MISIPTPYKILIAVAAVLLSAGGGYIKGYLDATNKDLKNIIDVQAERAETNAQQRDIANRAPASVDDMLKWLCGSCDSRK